MNIIGCQLDIAWENKKANYAKVQNLLQSANPPPNSLVVLPEMFSTGFSMNVMSVCEGRPSETELFLANTAVELGICVIGGVVNLGGGGRGRNEAVAYSPKGIILKRYCKIHPFSIGGESMHYAPGNEIVMFKWQDFIVAPFICYDLRFAEVFRLAALRGAQLFIVIANWPAKRHQHWTCLLRARAIENQAYVVGVNRCGSDPRLEYSGGSVIIDPLGEIVAELNNNEGVLSGNLDLTKLSAWRKEFPALKDSRPEFLPPIDYS